MPVTATVTFDGRQYDSVYATTNSVITFGAPDGTYWQYPQTPSISLYSMDWVAYPRTCLAPCVRPWEHDDEHFIISASDGGFQVDLSARPYWMQNAAQATNIIITAAINANGTVAISYAISGPTYDGQTRTGVRLNNGSIVTLDQYGVTRVETVPVLTPAPVETTTVTSPVESQTSTVDTSTSTPSDTSTVVDSSTGVVDSTTSQNTTSPSDATTSTGQEPQPVTPAPQEPVVIPRDPIIIPQEPEVLPEPIDPALPDPTDTPQEESATSDDVSPTEETNTQPSTDQGQTDQISSSDNSTVEQAISEAMADGVLTDEEKAAVADALIAAADGGAVSAEDIKAAGLTYDDLPPETPVDVRTDAKGNPVIIEAQVAAALVLLENPADLVGALFDDPGKALLAVASIGADMSPEERQQSEKVVVAAVIAGQAAIGAAGMAAQTTTTSGGRSSGGSSGGGGASGDSKGVRRRKP